MTPRGDRNSTDPNAPPPNMLTQDQFVTNYLAYYGLDGGKRLWLMARDCELACDWLSEYLNRQPTLVIRLILFHDYLIHMVTKHPELYHKLDRGLNYHGFRLS